MDGWMRNGDIVETDRPTIMGYHSCLQALQSLVVEALRIHAFQQAILLHAARDESAAAKNKSKFLSDLLFF